MNKSEMKRLSLLPDAALHAAIEAERKQLTERTGLRPSLSETACALIRKALAGNQADAQA